MVFKTELVDLITGVLEVLDNLVKNHMRFRELGEGELEKVKVQLNHLLSDLHALRTRTDSTKFRKLHARNIHDLFRLDAPTSIRLAHGTKLGDATGEDVHKARKYVWAIRDIAWHMTQRRLRSRV